MTINELITKAHEAAKSKGFWDKERNTGELLMLIVSECGEALEAHRNGRRADISLFNERLKALQHANPEVRHAQHMEAAFKECIKDTFEDELADIVIRIADLMGHLEYSTSMDPTNEQSFTNVGEGLLEVTDCICQYWSLEGNAHLMRAMNAVFEIANWHDIDLWRHIELKLAYNATRPALHGKNY